jgi:hypothetical protein
VQEIHFDDVEQPEAREMRYTSFIFIFIVDEANDLPDEGLSAFCF